MNLEQLRKAYAAKIAEAQALAAQWKGKEEQMTQEAARQIDTILGQADEIKAKINLAERLADSDQFLNGPGDPQAAHLGWRPAGPDEGAPAVDVKAWRQMEIATPVGVKTLRYHVPIVVQAKEYSPAFEGYLRKGFGELGPSDRKTLSAGVDSAGGFLVPEDYHAELIKKVATLAAIRSLARVVTTSRDMAKWPRVNYTTDDKYTSGVRLTWTGEQPASSSEHRVTDPVFGLITIPVHTAMASMPITNDLIEDAAFDVLGVSSDLMAEAFALGEDDVFLNGNGVNKPMGILAEVNTNGPAYVISGTSAAITTSGDGHSGQRLLNLYYAVPAQYRRNAAWVMNSSTLKEVENLVDAQKRPIVQTLLNAGLASDEPERVKGKPVRVDEFMPDIGTNTYPILFGDLSGYIVLDRVGFSLQRLSEIYAETNLTLLLGRKRVGGYCAEPYRMKVLKAGTS